MLTVELYEKYCEAKKNYDLKYKEHSDLIDEMEKRVYIEGIILNQDFIGKIKSSEFELKEVHKRYLDIYKEMMRAATDGQDPMYL